MKNRIFIFACLLLPLLILFPGYSSFIFPSGSTYSDLTISHYPNLIYLKNSLSTTGEIPFWSNTILGGYPFAANPLSGLWYPATWLILFLPQPFGFNLIVTLHLFIGGLGIFLCLKKSGVGKFGGILGAVSFELMPKLMAHYAAGHITLVFAICLTPWLIYEELNYRTRTHSFTKYVSGLLLGIITLADIRWAPYAGILFVVVRIGNILARKEYSNMLRESIKPKILYVFAIIREILFPILIALGVSAAVWLPLIQYTLLSTRNNLTISDNLSFSLAPVRLFNLFFPDIQGYCEWIIYPGALGLLSLATVLSSKKLWKKTSFWLLVLMVSFLWGLGSYNPIMKVVSLIPGLDLLRVPSRVLFMSGIAFSMITGIITDQLFTSQSMTKRMKLSVFFISIFSFILCLGLKTITHQWNTEFIWGALAFGLTGTIFLIMGTNKIKKIWVVFAILLSVLIIDVGTVDYVSADYKSKESIESENAELADWLSKQPGKFRVYSPSYSIPQLTAVKYGLELADGIDPMQLTQYSDFMLGATGIPGTEYSVTLPRFSHGNPDIDNQFYLPDAKLLGWLNIRYICSEFPIQSYGLIFIKKIGHTWIYENEFMHPRAWVQENDLLIWKPVNEYSNHVEITQYKPNKISLHSSGESGMLVLSEIDYPGWIVRVDGVKTEVKTIGNLLRGVEITSGEHEVEFIYRPTILYVGITISLITLIFMIVCSIKKNMDKYVR